MLIRRIRKEIVESCQKKEEKKEKKNAKIVSYQLTLSRLIDISRYETNNFARSTRVKMFLCDREEEEKKPYEKVS